MASLLLPLNGIGRGHLTRALIFSEWLREAGRRPIIALQGSCRYEAAPTVPTTHIPSLNFLKVEGEAQRVADDMAQVALMSGPSLLLEDTHPRRVRWPPELHHVIVVRPTLIDHMRLLQSLHGETAARILICDHPDSPTWPYDAEESAEIASWPRWACLGPVFRTAAPADVERLRQRYRVAPEQPLFVFSMGGGGEAKGSGDRVAFVAAAAELALQLRARRPEARFVFVRGPLFPPELTLPEPFEDVREEPDLPALFCLAHGVVVRPGYNVTWECIAAGVPFVALRGTTFNEPVGVRLEAMATRGFDTSPTVERLLDAPARARFGAACRETLARFDGQPRDLFLAYTRLPDPAPAAAPAPPAPPAPGPATTSAALSPELRTRLAAAVRAQGAPPPLRLRLDDVTRLDDETLWLLALCRELRLPLSLQVVPYHSTIAGAALDRLDPDGRVSVDQHGYAHLPEYRDGVRVRGELVQPESAAKAAIQLALGAGQLQRAFGSRFAYGYSSPYDVPPPTLATLWRAAGGRFISWMYTRPSGDALPCVRLSVDPWHWTAGGPRSGEALVTLLESTLRRDAAVGLVFHPQCLRAPADRQMAAELLQTLVAAGCAPTTLAPPAAPLTTPATAIAAAAGPAAGAPPGPSW